MEQGAGQDSERLLLQQLAQGEKQALQELFDRYYTDLCRTALRLVHRPEIAEEIVQDVFVALWEKRDRLHITVSIPAYLSRAVRNRCLNHLKSRAARYDWSEELTEYQHPVESGSPTDELQFSELNEALEHALQQLPEKSRLVYSMSRYEELTYREIATQLDVSVKTVEYHMGQALKQLRQHLAAYGYSLALIIFSDFVLGGHPTWLSYL